MCILGLAGWSGQSLTQVGRVLAHHNEFFIELDSSKLRNSVAIAEAWRYGMVRYLGEIDTGKATTKKLATSLASRYRNLTFF